MSPKKPGWFKGGTPLRCPACTGEQYYGRLKIPGDKRTPCPNCGKELVLVHPKEPRHG